VLGLFSVILVAFVIYSVATTANYRQLRVEAASRGVSYVSEQVSKVVAEMERNAVNLALAGYQLYLSGDRSDELGALIAMENNRAFTTAAGVGIWFEPYALRDDARRAWYGTFFDPLIGEVRYDTEFENDDYHSRGWYKEIAANLTGRYSTVWTAPYVGVRSMMTTVGAGIYDEDGRFLGMATVDWQIQSMVDRLSAIRPTENSFILFASPKDDYIITETRDDGIEYAGSSLRALPWYDEPLFTGADNVNARFTEGGVEYFSFSRMFDKGWLFSVYIPAREIFAEIEARNHRFSLIIGISFIFLLLMAYCLISRLVNRPLRKLTSEVAELGGGNLDKQIKILSKDEIGMLASAFNKMTVDLKASIERSALQQAEKERIGAELNVAAKIQASMLPRTFPAFSDRPEFDIYAGMQPAREVGGDFYDFFLIDKDKLAVVMADVSGKGMPAALFMVIAKTLIKSNAQNGKSPKEVFEAVNNLLCENNEACMFVTAFLGYLDIPDGTFTFVNAGHNPPLLSSGGRFEWLKTRSGFVLAGMEDMFYTQGEIIMQPGDELFLYTDGITEAENDSQELFGEPRLLDAVNKYPDSPPKEFIMSLKREVDGFVRGAEQADDVTMLALRYYGACP